MWLPRAHVEAPTSGSVLLAGILLKLGSYGFIRFLLFLFPTASFYFLPLILAIAVISIILPSFTVLRQLDLKRIIAYSSVAHMNFLVGAIFVQNLVALTGSLLLQIAHGLSSSALFLAIGMLYDRYKSRNIFYYAGLVTIMPLFSFFFFIFSLANLGFPSTFNFVSEMLIFIGMFQVSPSVTILTLSGIFFSAVYSFVLLTRLLFGPASRQIEKFYDLTRREFYILAPLGFLIFFLGLFPNYLIGFWSYNLVTWFTEPTFILAFAPIISLRKRINYTYILVLALSFICYIFSDSDVECGTSSHTNSGETLRGTVWRMYDNLNPDEIQALGERLAREQPQGTWPTNTELQPSSPWVSIFYFVALSATIVTISYFHREIIDMLFRVSNDVVVNAPSAMWNGIRFTRQIVKPMVEQHLQENPERLFNILQEITQNS